MGIHPKGLRTLKDGDKVHYAPKMQNGIVKKAFDSNKEAFVVFDVDSQDWDNYKNYTSALTQYNDLRTGWIFPRKCDCWLEVVNCFCPE